MVSAVCELMLFVCSCFIVEPHINNLLSLINVIRDNIATYILIFVEGFMCELNWLLSVHLLRISRESTNQETRRGIQKSWEQKSKKRVKDCVCLLECKLQLFTLASNMEFGKLWRFTVALICAEIHNLFFYLRRVDSFRRPQVFRKLLQVGSCFNWMVVH